MDYAPMYFFDNHGEPGEHRDIHGARCRPAQCFLLRGTQRTPWLKEVSSSLTYPLQKPVRVNSGLVLDAAIQLRGIGAWTFGGDCNSSKYEQVVFHNQIRNMERIPH